MLKHNTVFMAVLALCLAVAVGCAFYILGIGGASWPAIALAICAVAFGQIVALVMSSRVTNALETTQRKSSIEFTSFKRTRAADRQLYLSARDEMIALHAAQQRESSAVVSGLANLKQSYAHLAKDFQQLVANGRRAAALSAPSFVPRLAPPPVEAPIQPENASPFGAQLLVSLEPVVDLSTRATAHYRMNLTMQDDKGEELTQELFLHHADRIGARPELDVYVGREATSLLRRLRQRDPDLNIFMPIGAATLAAPVTIAKIMSDRQESGELASGIILELPHAMLAGLTEQALEGLAMLARHGAVFALSNVSVSGLDVYAMNTLNVRFISIDAGALDATIGPTAEMIGFAQMAKASHVGVIVSGVANPRLVASLPRLTKLAAGPCFATPRRVKREASPEAPAQLHAAA